MNFQVLVAQKASDKLVYLENRAEHFLKNKDSLNFYANKILKQSLIEKVKREEGLAYKYFAKVAFLERNYNKSEKLSKQAISIFKKIKNHNEEKGDCYLILGRNHIFKQEYDSAYVNLMNAQKCYKTKGKLKNPDSNYIVSNDVAYLYIVTGRHNEAMKILNANLKKEVSDDVLATVYSLFSILANYNSDFNESIKYFKLSIPIYKKLKQENAVLICEMDIAINHYYLKHYAVTIKGLNEVLKKTNTTEEHFPIMIRSNLFLSQCYFDQKKYIDAKKYFNVVEQLILKNPHEFDAMLEEIILECRIDFLIHEKKFAEAKNVIHKFLNENNDVWLSSKLTFYEMLKEIAISSGSNQEVHVYNDSIDKFQSQIKLEKESNSVALMRAEFKCNTVEKELELKNKEFELLKIKDRNNQIVLIFLLCIGVLSIIFFSILYSRKKKINEMREAILEKEKQYLESVNHQKLLEIEYKDKEIVGFAIHISEKNEILSTIKSRLKDLTSKEQMIQSKIKDLIFFINNTISQNSEKVNMYSEAEEIKELFLQKIKIEFPDLTDKEIRVAILVKMQLTSKQIGQQLNITPASVDNYRSVLRRKMNIPKEKNLLEFLNEIV